MEEEIRNFENESRDEFNLFIELFGLDEIDYKIGFNQIYNLQIILN